MYDANRVRHRRRLYIVHHDYDICLLNVVNVQCNLWLIDQIEQVDHNDANTEWSFYIRLYSPIRGRKKMQYNVHSNTINLTTKLNYRATT